MQSYKEMADDFLAECKRNAKEYRLGQAQLTYPFAPCYRLPWWPEAIAYFYEIKASNIVRNGRKGSKENFVNDVFAKRVYRYFCTLKQQGVLQQFFSSYTHAITVYDKVMEAFEGHHGTNHSDTNLDNQIVTLNLQNNGVTRKIFNDACNNLKKSGEKVTLVSICDFIKNSYDTSRFESDWETTLKDKISEWKLEDENQGL
ncbi:hypothetical protein [Candidatus Methylobacter oryzae]|uniref:Uncharacterized protein n=1 Tax=Candidatus Methylobacter oryzae TaxID=2497749 RepID=A0ABY3CAX2_9GAMM|nr:hypothetical protein [Candidatus Methylobacter oryzae]TRW95826.1 hypothetical protein EKO24_009470 [Candidatus Methylobacter oryzae]